MDGGVWQVLLLLLFAAVFVEGMTLVAVTRQVGSILLQITPPRPGVVEGGPEEGSDADVPASSLPKLAF